MGQETRSLKNGRPWYRHWLAITALFLTFPISLPLFGIYYVWAKTTWQQSWKVGATVVLLPFFLFGTALVFSTNETSNQQPSPTAVSVTDGQKDDGTATSTPEIASEPQSGTSRPSEIKALASTSTPGALRLESTSSSASNSTLYAVTKVVDGDTFRVSINGKEETVRLIGMNTPESVDPRKPVECFGLQASNKAKNLLAGKKVSLEADPTQGERDKYSRLLRYAYLETGTSFNKLMISEGYAYEYTYGTPYKYQKEYKQAQAEAKAAKRGLWAENACPPVVQTTNGIRPASGSSTAPAPTTPPPQPSGSTFYTSSHYSAKLYYCDTDEGWKSLSTRYLKSFTSERELLAAFPNRTLHEPCR